MIATHKGEIPFLILLLPFLAGIGIGIYYPIYSFSSYLETILLILGIAFIGLNLLYKALKLYRIKWIGGVLIHTILLVLGYVAVFKYDELNDEAHFAKSKADYLLVKINNEPKVTNGILRCTATVEAIVANNKQINSTGNILIAIKDSAAHTLYYGDKLLIPTVYKTIDPPFNPAEFNYKRYLAFQNIHYQAFLYPQQYVVLAKNTGNSIVSYSLRLRQRLVEKLKHHLHNQEAIAVASTLILGYKADLSNEVLQAYSKTGTIHVLSVSGAHVAIVLILLNFVLGFLDRFKHGKLIKAIHIIGAIWYYSLLSGFSPAVCRAAVMISMVIIGKTYSRYINTLNILAVSAFFLLLYNPYFVADVGFQLSYLAVFGLIVLQPIIYKWLNFENKWVDKLWLLCSVSIAAQIITFPLSAFYFHQFPIYFLISNLFIIIPSLAIMYAGIAYLIIPDIPIISNTLGWILEKSILIMNKVLAIVEHTPYSGINKIWITNIGYLLLYGIIMSFFYFLHKRKVWLLQVCLGCLLIFSIVITLKRWNTMQSDAVVKLKLRKHIGTIFREGHQAIVFSDLRDTDKAYKYTIQPYLDSCQVSTVYHIVPKPTKFITKYK